MNQGNLCEASAGISSQRNSSRLPTDESFSRCLLSHQEKSHPQDETLARKGQEGLQLANLPSVLQQASLRGGMTAVSIQMNLLLLFPLHMFASTVIQLHR